MSNRTLNYRGQLAGSDAGSSQGFLLSTRKGEKGYRIKNLQIIQKSPGAVNNEGLVTIWKTEPTAAEIAATTIDLSNNRILAVAFYSASLSANVYPEDTTIIFDNEIFNQDIFMSYIDVSTSNDAMNYYLELETISLDESQAMVATLKDIRNNS